MSSEKQLWSRIRSKIAHFGHFNRVESICTVGFPDVDYCIDGFCGKIELKYAHKWPAKPTTRVFKPGHNLRDEQIKWMKLRLKAGSKSLFILAGVEDSLFLFNVYDYPPVLDRFNEFNKQDFFRFSCWAHTGNMGAIDWVDLIRELKL